MAPRNTVRNQQQSSKEVHAPFPHNLSFLPSVGGWEWVRVGERKKPRTNKTELELQTALYLGQGSAFLFLIYSVLCVWLFYLHITCAPHAYLVTRKSHQINPQELELRIVFNWCKELNPSPHSKNTKYSKTLSHLSSPRKILFCFVLQWTLLNADS